METKTVTFIKAHPMFSDSDELGVPKELSKDAAQKAIDLGVAYAGKGKADVETATATGGATTPDHSLMEPVSDNAVTAATDQRTEAKGLEADSMAVGSEEGETVVPVGTEPDGNKVLIRPEDNELAEKKEADAKKAKK